MYKSWVEKGERKPLSLSIFLSCCEVLPVLGVTLFIQKALNQSVHNQDLLKLVYDGLGVIGCTILIALLALTNTKIALKINRTISSRLYHRIIDQCFKINPTFFHHNHSVSTHHSILHDTEKFHSMIFVFLVKFLPAAIVACAITLFLLFLSPLLTLILMGGMPLFFFCSRKIEKKVKKRIRSLHESIQSTNQGIRFLFDMMDLIKTYSTEENEKGKQLENVKNQGKATDRYFWTSAVYNLTQNFIIAVMSILILVVGGSMVIQGTMSWNHLIVFYIALGMMKRYMQTAISSIPTLIEGHLAFQKVLHFLALENTPLYQGEKQINFKGSVEFRDVAFGFTGKNLFEKVSFSLNPGEIIALIGPNGAGKSTIANLILGFYKPNQGEIYFDDEPINELELKTLRSSIAIVRQNPLIFPATIGENLLYGSPETSIEQLKEIAQLVGLTQFIEQLPHKYETATGMGGHYLSGGQKQKIALARALLRKPKLLILDEPTNHLDAPSIQSMLEAMKEWKKSMSILLISHHKDLSSLADRIYFLQEHLFSATLK